MGLNVSAAKQLQLLGYAVNWDAAYEQFDEDVIHINVNADFPDQQAGLPLQADQIAVFAYAERRHFFSASYFGYNLWRQQLSQTMCQREPEAIWNQRNDPAVRALPFYELIDFTDCDGEIGPIVARKLAADFAAHQTQADEVADDWFRQSYANFRAACEFAADNGVVRFA